MSFDHNKVGQITHDTVFLPPYGYLMKVQLPYLGRDSVTGPQ